jgi:hypothetical protein
MTSSREGGSGLPYPRRHDTGDLPAPVTAKLWMEDAPATQAMMMVPPRALEPWPDTDHSFEQRRTSQEG